MKKHILATTSRGFFMSLLLLLITFISTNACHVGCMTDPGTATLSGTTVNISGVVFTNPSSNCGPSCTYTFRVIATPDCSGRPTIVNDITYASQCSDSCFQVTCPPQNFSVSGLCPGRKYTITLELRNSIGSALVSTDNLSGSLTCNNVYNYGDFTPAGPIPIATMTTSCPADLFLYCSDTIPAAPTAPALVGASVCEYGSTNPIPTYTEVTTGNGCWTDKVVTRTWEFTDVCGIVTHSCSYTITKVRDITPPLITTFAGGTTPISCSDTIAFTPPVFTDACPLTTTYVDTDIPTWCPNSFTRIRTYTATDGCHSTSSSFSIYVQDIVAPTWVTPAGSLDVTLNCNDTAGLAAAQAAMPIAQDNCDNDVTNIVKTSWPFIASGCLQSGSYTNTWRVTDDCGNLSQLFTQTITIQDTTKPVWATAAGSLDTFINCDDGIAGVIAAQALAPVASDNCDNYVLNIIKTAGALTPGACPQSSTYTNTWTVTDDCGNISDMFTQTITVQDTVKPTWVTAVAALDVTLNCDDTTGLTNAQAASPLATDNCDNDVTNIVKTAGAFMPGTCPQSGTYTNTWTVTDDCGNVSDMFIQTITIQDTVKPTWVTAVAALDVTLTCGDTTGLTNAQAASPLASDNCDNNVTNIAKTAGALTPGTCTYTNTWTVTDDCGNVSDMFTQTITIQDTVKPTWVTAVASLDVTLNCDDTTGLTNAQAASPLASDNCDNDVTNIVKTAGTFIQGTCPHAGSYTNTWTVTDDCGNVSDVFTQTITVQDTTGPSWTTPAGSLNATVECSDSVGYMMIHMQRPNVMDNCSPFGSLTEVLVLDSHYVDPLCPSAEFHTHRWKWLDECGNESPVWEMLVTITDTTRPAWITAIGSLDTLLSCDDAAGLSVAQTAAPIAYDNCDNDVTNIIKTTGAFTPGTCPQSGTYTNTWTVTDDCGNVSDAFTQTITIQDTVAPIINPAPANITINCSDSIPAGVQLNATDNCDTSVLSANFTEDAYTPSCNGYTITRRWNVNDACNNSAIERVQTITVNGSVLLIDTPLTAVNCSNGTVTVNSSSSIDCAPLGSTLGIKLTSCPGCTGASDTVGTIKPAPASFIMLGGNSITFAAVVINGGNEICSGTPETINIVPDYCQFPLPIIYKDIYLTSSDCSHTVHWTTLEEQHADKFEIEYSEDGVSFVKIGSVPAKNRANGVYSFENKYKKRPEGLSYYRVKQYDFDGQFTYSKILNSVNNCKNNEIVVTLFPNPTSSKLNVSVASSKSKMVKLRLVNLLGKEVLNEKLVLANGSLQQMNVKHLANGQYFLLVLDPSSSEKLEAIKFTKE